MQDKSETEIISKKVIRAFLQFKRLRMNDSVKFSSDHPHHFHDNIDHHHHFHEDNNHFLKPSEIMLMYELKDVEDEYPSGISVSDLSHIMRVKPPSITSLITSLEKKDMIERTMDPNDRRIIRLKLTETGRQCIEKQNQHTVEKINGLVEYLGKEKSAQLASLINDVFMYFISQANNKNIPKDQ
ncbi:MAG: MarR family transcriptional regulator [Bacillota bacterium]|nr:MarR family transcriptional regulator [Bacillota bacterium]